MEDFIEHRCRYCPARQELYAEYADLMTQWDSIAKAFTLRLLPSRNSIEGRYKLLCSQTTSRKIGLSKMPSRPHVDLFTDGSCLNPSLSWASAGAWAIVSATHDCTIAKGVLSGLTQTSDLAELVACKEAVAYATLHSSITTIWTDSAYAATGLHGLLRDPADPPQDLYAEEWQQVQHLLFGHADRIQVQHVNSHQASLHSCTDLDDWIVFWNQRADHEAMSAHLLRDADLEHTRTQMIQHHQEQLTRMEQLVNFHLSLAQTSFKAMDFEDEADEPDPTPDDWFLRRLCLEFVDWQSDLPLQIAEDWRVSALVERFGVCFTHGMLHWLRGLASEEDVVAFKLCPIWN